ncbi:hypothetical protein MNBD_GAMMA26-2589, partial [hydrothermal vent metagenome]
NRVMIRVCVGADIPEGDGVIGGFFQLATGKNTAAIAVKQQC